MWSSYSKCEKVWLGLTIKLLLLVGLVSFTMSTEPQKYGKIYNDPFWTIPPHFGRILVPEILILKEMRKKFLKLLLEYHFSFISSCPFNPTWYTSYCPLLVIFWFSTKPYLLITLIVHLVWNILWKLILAPHFPHQSWMDHRVLYCPYPSLNKLISMEVD